MLSHAVITPICANIGQYVNVQGLARISRSQKGDLDDLIAFETVEER